MIRRRFEEFICLMIGVGVGYFHLCLDPTGGHLPPGGNVEGIFLEDGLENLRE